MPPRRASASVLEVKHGNFSHIKSPSRPSSSSPRGKRGSDNSPRGSDNSPRVSDNSPRGSDRDPGASPRGSPTASPAPVDVGLSRAAYSKARNIMLAKRSSVEESMDENEGGFKKVGKALLSGMSTALFHRRGSGKNPQLMKSLVAAISKEKLLAYISEMGLEENVTEMMDSMYQSMIDLLIDNYGPLEDILSRLLADALEGAEDLEKLVEELRGTLTKILRDMVEKQTMSGPIVITEEQESLVNRVAEVAQGMGSEIAFTVRMRGGGKRRSRGPHAQGEEGDESHEGEGGRQFSHLKPGEGGHPDFKKAVKKMQLMNTLGPQGPAFHTAMRNEKRKHAHEEGLEVVGHSDRAGLNSGSGSDQRRNRTNSISRMDSGRSGSRPGTSSSITKDQIASSLGLGSGNPVPNSPDRRPDSANSYRMAPSSTSGLSLGGLSDKEDGHGKPGQSDSQTPFGFFSDLVDNALPGSSSLSSAMTVLKQDSLVSRTASQRGEAGTSSTSARGLLLNRLIKDVDGSDEEEVRSPVTSPPHAGAPSLASHDEANRPMESPGLSPAPETVAETGAARHAQAPGSAGHQEEEEAAQRPKPGQKVHIVDIEGTEEEIGFTDWETFSQHLLRQGIKLKVPKPWRPGSESGRFAGKARDGARLDPAGRGHAGFGPESRPVHASTNAMLQRAWRSQVATDLEQVYQQRASRFQDLPDSPRYVPSLSLMPLLGKRHMRGWARNRQAYDEEMSRFKVPKIKLRDSKQPIMAFRSTCFCSSNRILPEIETWPVISEDFQDSVYSLSLEHSRSSWSDTSTLLESPKKSPSKRPRGSKGLQNFHRQFRAVLP